MSRKRTPEPEASTPPGEPTDTAEPSGPQVLPDASPGAGETRRKLEVVTSRDELGRPVEVVEVTDLTAVSHWRDEDWHPLR